MPEGARAGGGSGRLLACLARVGAAAGGAGGEPVVLQDRGGVLVVQVGSVVVKAHAPGTDPAALAARLRAAARRPLRGILLPPLPVGAGAAPGTGGLAARACGRLVTAWPAGERVRQDAPGAAPWEQAAELLARLHAVPPAAAGTLPPAGGPARVARALARLRAAGGGVAAAEVRRAAATLPPWARGEGPLPPGRAAAVAHGDWHLGQVVRARPGPGVPAAPRGAGGWRLIDVDDLGVGDPAWDLARPAAWYAAGLLPPATWGQFLGAYQAAGGRAVPGGDPWAALDVPARALAVQAAALGVAAAAREGRPLDGVEVALVDACRRIARVGGA